MGVKKKMLGLRRKEGRKNGGKEGSKKGGKKKVFKKKGVLKNKGG